MASYNTGTTGTLAAAAHTTAFTYTVPAGVAVGDVMLVTLDVFTYPGTTASFGTPTSGGGSWAQIGATLSSSFSGGAQLVYGLMFWRVATAADPGSTFSISYTGPAGTTDQIWWASTIESYTGFYTAAPIGNYATVTGQNTPFSAPAVSTSADNSWSITTGPIACASGGSITAEPGTLRNTVSNSGISCCATDSAGSVGVAGTAIGGGTQWNTSGGTAGSGNAFTVELRTQGVVGQVVGVTRPQIPHPLWHELLEIAATRADWQAQGVASAATSSNATHWRLMDGALGRPGIGSTGTQPPATGTNNATAFINGMTFYVTQSGMWFEGYWYYCAASGQSTSPAKFALWSLAVNNSGVGSVVPGSVVTSGTLTAGAWNWVPLPQPVQISPYGVYRAAVGIPAAAGFPDTAAQFGSGQPYANGVTNGPLSMLSAVGGGNTVAGIAQCVVNTASGSDPSTAMPNGVTGNNDNLWLDVQVTNAPPNGYTGSYRLWPNTIDADFASQTDSAVNYVVGTEIRLSQACVVNRIWYYLPAGTAQFATSADIWRVQDGANIASQSSPAWKTPSGAAATFTSGPNGDSAQWVYCTLPGPVTLSAGNYRVSVYNGATTPDQWSAKRLFYWEPGHAGTGPYQTDAPGINGITSGPLYAPPTPLAGPAVDYTDSHAEPGQSVFAVGPPNKFPNTYVGPAPTQQALFQNYWVDLEVSLPVSTSTGLLLAMFP